MGSTSPFLQGVKAAMPIWIAFVPLSLGMGIAARTHGLHLEEIVLMSALVYAGPAQFAALEPLASGKPALQIFLTVFLLNIRLLVMGAALSAHFHGLRRTRLLISAHFISASSFILSYVRFQKSSSLEGAEGTGSENLRYFLGTAIFTFSLFVVGSGLGYSAALRFPAGFEEGLKFILPGYFACMLVTELRGQGIALIVCLASLVMAVPGATVSPDWGWLITALLIATVGWGVEEWTRPVSE